MAPMSTTSTSPKSPRSRWVSLIWAVPLAIVGVAGAILLARWLRESTGVGDFIADYPGEYPLPEWAPVGFPAWLSWQHFLNAFFIVLLIRSGMLIRYTKRPQAYWTRHNKRPLKTKAQPKRHTINHWLHFAIDWLWIVNGVVFVVLLFVSGQWVRVVPTSWDVFPHAISVGVQYVSFDWPTENGWVNYNSLQQLAYGLTIFVAAPLAAVTGFRMSPIWRTSWTRWSRAFPIELARAVHFPVMIYFVLFIVAHVTLVLATNAQRNLNHIYGGSDDASSWLGVIVFGGTVALMIAAWFAVRPMILRPIAQLSGKVSRG